MLLRNFFATRARTSLCLGTLLSLTIVCSQVLASEARSVRFQHASRDEGLSQSFVYTIVQDPQGYMWFGTQDGLNRFDGHDFKVFDHDPNDQSSISDESIRTMIRARSGTLWIGTDAGGLSRYDSASETFRNFLHDPTDPTSISDNRVRTLHEDSASVLWVGTDGNGLDRFDYETETFMHYRHNPSNPHSLSSNNIWDILEDSDGVLWVATDNGLNVLNPSANTFSHYRHDPNDPDSISDDRLRVLYEDTDNALWIGTEKGGLNRFDRTTGKFERFKHDPADPTSLAANRINSMHQDDAGVLWIGTLQGLSAWNPATRSFETYANNPNDRYSLIHNNVSSIYQDRGGVLWVGTYNGLSWWNQNTRAMLHFRSDASNPHSLSEDTVMGFAEDNDENIWVATYGGGLNVLDRSTDQMRHFRHSVNDDTTISSDLMMSLHVGSDGVLWAGTRTSGLNRYDEASNTFARFRHDPEDPNSLSADGVTFIFEDSNERLWVGTFGGGLNQLDRESGTFKRYTHDPTNSTSLSNDRVLLMFEDSARGLWLGTYGGGLNHFDPASGAFTHYRAEPGKASSLPGDEIYMIQEEDNGDFWIGVKGAGLVRWQREDRELGNANFEHFSLADGLPSTTIYGGLWDDEGFLWLSSGRGLTRLDTSTLEFICYDSSHGLQGDEFNLSANLRAMDGQLFFGGVNGFNAFYPQRLGANDLPPQVSIQRFLSLNAPVDIAEYRSNGTPVELDHTQNVISFEYVALDFAASNKNRYMYRLDGLDRDWTDAGDQRQVTYTNLPAGDYTFRVKAANNERNWSEEEAVLALNVMPAPWLTWWAYAIYIAMFAAGIFLVFRSYSARAEHAAKLKYAEDFALVQERLKDAQRIASIGNWEWNADTEELWWSDEFYRLFGMEPNNHSANFDELIERVHIDDRERVKQIVDDALNSGNHYETEYRIVRPDGSLGYMNERVEVSFGDDGKPLRLAGTINDISERKEAENELRRNAEFQALLAELSSRLMMARTSDIDEPMKQGLSMIGSNYDLDAISVWWFTGTKEGHRSSHRWVRKSEKSRQTQASPAEIPWITEQLLAGKTVAISNLENLPAEARSDRKLLARKGVRSILIIPLRDDDRLLGACAFGLTREARLWTAETIAELKLIAEALGGANARSRAVAAIEKLQKSLQAENVYLKDEVRLAHGFAEIIGEDRGLKTCLMAVEKVAPTDVPVLILGETGTGKELIARAVHNLSERRDRPLVSVNCPTLPANIIESELFGHEKGAFTGAHAQRRGRFEMADTGTIFLDEIGELPIELQSKLLRVLQTGDFVRLGGDQTLHTDVRVIAATNRDLKQAIALGEFRSDLYYRISSFPIRLPALRDRKGDIPLLAEHFVRKSAERLDKKIDSISAKMISALTEYSWPGNVRELESIIERAMISSSGTTMLELPKQLQSVASIGPASSEPPEDLSPSGKRQVDLSTAERIHIVGALEQTEWRISGEYGAAALLGIPPSTLRSKMKRLGIKR